MQETLEFLCESKNGTEVLFDPVHSHAATHFEDTPSLKSLVIDAIAKLNLNGDEIGTHVDMGKMIGICDVVTVSDNDEIVYGIRKNRDDDGLVPFVKNREGDPCSTIALHLVPQNEKVYILSSAWVGTFGGDDEPFPLAVDATEKSAEFWDTHAFVYGSQEIVKGTETSNKPW